MDLQLTYPVLLAFLLFIVMALKIVMRKPNSRGSTTKLPPGPWKLPIIGNMHQLGGPLPHQTLSELAKKYGPLMHLKMGEVSTVVFSSPETAKEVLKTHDIIFASRPPILATRIMSYDCTSITFAPYGDYWRQLRKICILELLSSKRVLSYRSIREDEMLNLVRWITARAGTAINLTEKIYSTQYSMTSRAAFGKECKEQDRFIGVIKEAIKFVGGFGIADLFPSVKLLHVVSGVRPKIEKLHHESDRMLEEIIREHRKNRSENKNADDCENGDEDLVDVLLKFQKQGDQELSLTTENIKAVILVS